MTPAVSVIIPTFNRQETLAAAVASAAAQTHRDLEIVVVDDGSASDPEPFVRGNCGGRPVQFLRHERNRGVAAARNTGLAAARGAFVAFLDSDDRWVPGKLEAQLAAVARESEPPAIFCACRTAIGGPDGETVRPIAGPPDGSDFSEYLYVWNGFAQSSSFLLARDAALRIGFDTSLSQYEDHLFFLRAGEAGLKYRLVPEALSVWNNDPRPGRLSLADNIDRGRRFAAAAGPALSRRGRLAFEAKYLGPMLLKDSPVEAFGLLAEALAAGAIGPRGLASILLRTAMPASRVRALRRALPRRLTGQA